jgi:hypothetical protein
MSSDYVVLPSVKPRLDHFGDKLSIYQNCFDLRDGVRENRERKIPGPEFDELEPEAMTMCVCVCVCVVVMVAVVLPVAHANPRSVGDVGGGRLRTINLVRRAGRPPTLYIAQRQGPTVHKQTDAPDQSAREGVGRAVGLVPIEINLTFSPLISTLL